MAERRMFAKSVVGSARFLKMPPTSRLLFYDLGMQADDDGIVEAFTVLRTTGAAEDDLKVLVSKGFVQILNEDLVAYITDWSTNNQLRRDRYRPSIYAELLVKLNDGNQAATIGITDGNQTATDGKPDVNQVATQDSIGKDRLGKSRVDKRDRADKPPARAHFVPPTLAEVTAYVNERGSNIDPQHFIDYYEARGRVAGKNRMKDWKAAIRCWGRWEKKPNSRNQLKTSADYERGNDFFSGVR